MANLLLRGVKAAARAFGLDVVRHRPSEIGLLPPDLDQAAVETIRRVRPYTMTSPERLFALIQATRYVTAAGIPGDVVECGVWRGGSVMAAALTLLNAGDASRNLYLFDTFEGMSAPTDRDIAIDGSPASSLLDLGRRLDPDSAWCYATQDEVALAMRSTGYDPQRVHFVKGKVEETLPSQAPDRISLLRLDTDWYESTRHELEHLFPRLSRGGVLIIDDYGHWAGCREAVDDYLRTHRVKLLLSRIDYTGRMAVKTE